MKRNGDQTCFRKDIKAFMFSKGTFLVKSQPTVRMYPPHLPRHPGRPEFRPGPAPGFRTGRLRLNGPGSSSDQGHRYAGRLLEIEGHWSDVSSGHGWVPLTLLDCGVLRKRYQRGYGSSRGNSSFIEDAGGACKYRPPPDKIHMNPNCFGKWFGGK
jgi:hypothetical protein